MNIAPISPVNSKTAVSTLGFTSDQSKAYNSLIDFINSPFDSNDFKRALVGPAGTGKTYLVKALIMNCNLNPSQIGLSAPTHKACRVLGESIGVSGIKVNTLQSDLGLRLNFDVDKFDINNPPFDPKGKIKLDVYRVYIVDEASMINKDLCTFLEKTCKSKQCKLIYIGDAAQLPPPKENYSSALRSIKTNTLKQIVRQEDDNPIRPLLDLLRYDITHNSFTFLNHISKNKSKFDEGNTKGYAVCTPPEFNEIVTRNFNDEELTRNVDYCKVIGFTNLCVSSWNKFIRNTTIEGADNSIITKNDLIISYTTIVNQFNDIVIANSEEYILQDVVNFVHTTYNLKGFLVRFISIHGGKTTTPLFVLDHTDRFSISKYVMISEQLITSAKTSNVKLRAQRWREYYAFKESCLLLTNIANNITGDIMYSRDLDYGFSLTAHKSQGSTFDTTLVDVDDIVFDKNGRLYSNAEQINRRLYVACSRAKSKLYLKFTLNNK